jgi:hypothetical protein
MDSAARVSELAMQATAAAVQDVSHSLNLNIKGIAKILDELCDMVPVTVFQSQFPGL